MDKPKTPEELVDALGDLSDDVVAEASLVPEEDFDSADMEEDYFNRAVALIAETFERWLAERSKL